MATAQRFGGLGALHGPAGTAPQLPFRASEAGAGLEHVPLAANGLAAYNLVVTASTGFKGVEGLHIPGSARPPARPELRQAQIGCSSDSEDLSFFAKIDIHIHTKLGPRPHRPAAPNFHAAT